MMLSCRVEEAKEEEEEEEHQQQPLRDGRGKQMREKRASAK